MYDYIFVVTVAGKDERCTVLHQPTLTLHAEDRMEQRMHAAPHSDNDRWLMIGLTVLGGLIIAPFFGLPYLHFLIAKAGFLTLPFLLAVYVWYRDVI